MKTTASWMMTLHFGCAMLFVLPTNIRGTAVELMVFTLWTMEGTQSATDYIDTMLSVRTPSRLEGMNKGV